MPVIKILPHPEYCPEGARLEAAPGTSVCEALLEHDIEIEHACEMSCACTNCHVVVRFDPGGSPFRVHVLPDEDATDRVTATYGPYTA